MTNPNKYPSLSDELLAMLESDQAIRIQWKDKRHDPEWQLSLDSVDAANTQRLKEIVDQQGWPTPDNIAEDALNAAWTIVQHADKDVSFQRHCLELMKKVPIDKIPAWQVAYLTDRVLLNEGGSQLYGTQFRWQNDNWEAYNLQDPETVDTRRLAFGMEPLVQATIAMNKSHP